VELTGSNSWRNIMSDSGPAPYPNDGAALIHRIAANAPPGFVPTDRLWEEVARAYATPGRHYHALRHVAEVSSRFHEVGTWRDPVDVFVAVLAHDAVYDVSRLDNEERSAVLGRRWFEELVGRDGAKVERLVRATAGHGGPPPEDDPDLLAFLDCDLAILGAAPADYDAYARGVEAEYTAVIPADAFRAGRRRFLERMLAAPRIFHTDRFEDQLGAAARANLARELASAP
jgi:predicted metal-dependent HD superfamily phosphohydrolase